MNPKHVLEFQLKQRTIETFSEFTNFYGESISIGVF